MNIIGNLVEIETNSQLNTYITNNLIVLASKNKDDPFLHFHFSPNSLADSRPDRLKSKMKNKCTYIALPLLVYFHTRINKQKIFTNAELLSKVRPSTLEDVASIGEAVYKGLLETKDFESYLDEYNSIRTGPRHNHNPNTQDSSPHSFQYMTCQQVGDYFLNTTKCQELIKDSVYRIYEDGFGYDIYYSKEYILSTATGYTLSYLKTLLETNHLIPHRLLTKYPLCNKLRSLTKKREKQCLSAVPCPATSKKSLSEVQSSSKNRLPALKDFRSYNPLF